MEEENWQHVATTELQFSRTTPGTHLFKEEEDRDDGPVIRNLYVLKGVFSDGPPQRIRVTIDALE